MNLEDGDRNSIIGNKTWKIIKVNFNNTFKRKNL